MIVEIEEAGTGKNLIVVSEVINITMHQETTHGESLKWWTYIRVMFKNGNNINMSFQENKKEAQLAYDKLNDALKMVYAKDSVKDMIKKALENE